MDHREHTETQDTQKKSSFQSTWSSTEPAAPTLHSGGQLSTQLGTAGGGAGCGQLPSSCTVRGAQEGQTQILTSIQMSGSCSVPTEPSRMGPTQLAQHHMGTVWESRLNTSWPKFRKQSLLHSTTPYKYT